MLDMSWTPLPKSRPARPRSLRKCGPATGLYGRHLFAARPEEGNEASALFAGRRTALPGGRRRTSNGALIPSIVPCRLDHIG